MDFLKKSGIYLIVILLMVSIYKDLTSGSTMFSENKKSPISISESQKFNVIKVKVKSGDTVLSIMEEVNSNKKKVDINKFLSDFKIINNEEPHELEVGKYYYFPVYDSIP